MLNFQRVNISIKAVRNQRIDTEATWAALFFDARESPLIPPSDGGSKEPLNL